MQCTFLKMACNSKTPVRRGKLSEICYSGVVVVSLWGTFDLIAFNVILELFSGLFSQNGMQVENGLP